MNATQTALFVKQLFLVGPLALTEACPQISVSAAFVILLALIAFLFFRFASKNVTNALAILARLLVSWVFASCAMITAAYLAL